MANEHEAQAERVKKELSILQATWERLGCLYTLQVLQAHNVALPAAAVRALQTRFPEVPHDI